MLELHDYCGLRLLLEHIIAMHFIPLTEQILRIKVNPEYTLKCVITPKSSTPAGICDTQ
jgi:hypothetical protein